MERLRAANPLRVGDVTIVPVERTDIQSDTGNSGCWIGGFKTVFAVVVRDAKGVRALAADSSEIPLDDLIRETPNLRGVIAELQAP